MDAQPSTRNCSHLPLGEFRRWAQFNIVGIVGAALQLVILTTLVNGLGLDPRIATVLAVEVALLHNFLLHERWTWRDRPSSRGRQRVCRLMRFHLCNGLVSMIGNLALIQLLAVQLKWPVGPAGLVAIMACSLINFALSHRLVFREDTPA